jgi:2-C-methyl-D-erythritol 4-phosphate cytidylyltransferase
VEHAGFPVAFFRGERMNFKITYPEDIKMAVALIQSQKRPD